MGMFDDLIEQVQNTPQPASATIPPPPPVEESPLDSAGRALGNTVTLGQAPNIGGAVNYVMEGGAPGSFEQGYQRSVGATENSQAQNPDAYTGGNMAGGALMAGLPAVKGAQLLTLAPRMLGRAFGSKLVDVLREARSAEQAAPGPTGPLASAEFPNVGMTAGGPRGPANWPSPLAEALKQSKEAPSSGGGALSAEMRAALKRGKFRHQYNNVKGGI